MAYLHGSPEEAQCCPICNPGVFSPQVAEGALARAHQAQEILWKLLELVPTDDLAAEMERRLLTKQA